MKFTLKTGNPEKQRSSCLIIGVFANKRLTPSAKLLDKASKRFLTRLFDKGDLTGELGQTLLLQAHQGWLAERVLLVGCGQENKLNARAFEKVTAAALQVLKTTTAKEVHSYLHELVIPHYDLEWNVQQLVKWTLDAHYQFDRFKTTAKKKFPLKEMVIMTSASKTLEQAIMVGEATAQGMALTKDLANLPANFCTPSYLAEHAKKLANQYRKITTSVLNDKQIRDLKMGALYSVGQGSKNPPRLITMNYKGGKTNDKPIVFVGKGITFDTGGNSLKPAMSMIGMKYDMCGAATVFGVIQAAAKLKLPLNIIGVVAAAENMPGNSATRPEDIVTTLSGQTVEILNTDAEGRLVLCDALTYIKRHNPKVVIDIATLTGACVMTFGHHASAVMSNDEALSQDLMKAGEESLDRCWPLPLWDEYQETLKSQFADMANIASPSHAGTITAGCFLSKFTTKYRWAHIDIAGTASVPSDRGLQATARPVSLLVRYLLNQR